MSSEKEFSSTVASKIIKNYLGKRDTDLLGVDDLIPIFKKFGICGIKANPNGKNMFQQDVWKVKVYRAGGISDKGVSESIVDAFLIATARVIFNKPEVKYE